MSKLEIKQSQLFAGGVGWAIVQTQRTPNSGKLYRIANGGKQWSDVTGTLPEGSSPELAFIQDDQSLVLLSEKNNLPSMLKIELTPYITTDGGENWTKGETIAFHEGVDYKPDQVFFVDREHGWLIGEVLMGHSYETGYEIFDTQDGGLHWQVLNDPIEQRQNPNIPFLLWSPRVDPFQPDNLLFTSQTRGYLVNRKLEDLSLSLAITNDGGITWTSNFIPIPDPVSIPKDVCCRQYISLPQFYSVSSGFLIQQLLRNDAPGNYFDLNYSVPEASYLQFTQDGGKSWSSRSAPAKMGNLFFLDQQTGWYVGKDDLDAKALTQVFQTTDGGKIWHIISPDVPLPLGSNIRFIDKKNGFATFWDGFAFWYTFAMNHQAYNEQTGKNSLFFITSDGGRTWTKVDPTLNP